MADDDVGRRHQRRVVRQRRLGVVTGQVDGDGVVPAEAELVGEKIPAPRPVPGAMDKGEARDAPGRYRSSGS